MYLRTRRTNVTSMYSPAQLIFRNRRAGDGFAGGNEVDFYNYKYKIIHYILVG